MGLDMYLERKKEIRDEVGYWRKANQIHKWFVTNCNNGNEYNGVDIEVTTENLKELKTVCEKVINASVLVEGMVNNGEKMTEKGWEPIMEKGRYIKNPSVAMKLLPTESGFFFGSTDYGEWYLEDLKHTIEIIEKALKECSEDEKIYYNANW